MNEGRRVYRAHINERFSPETGIGVFTHYGHVSPCGQWVDGNAVRWPLTSEWRETEAEAEAVLAPRIAEIGARLLKQSAELLEAARAMEVAT